MYKSCLSASNGSRLTANHVAIKELRTQNVLIEISQHLRDVGLALQTMDQYYVNISELGISYANSDVQIIISN